MGYFVELNESVREVEVAGVPFTKPKSVLVDICVSLPFNKDHSKNEELSIDNVNKFVTIYRTEFKQILVY